MRVPVNSENWTAPDLLVPSDLSVSFNFLVHFCRETLIKLLRYGQASISPGSLELVWLCCLCCTSLTSLTGIQVENINKIQLVHNADRGAFLTTGLNIWHYVHHCAKLRGKPSPLHSHDDTLSGIFTLTIEWSFHCPEIHDLTYSPKSSFLLDREKSLMLSKWMKSIECTFFLYR